MTDFGKKFAIKISRFGSFYCVKTTYFAFFVLFEEQDFEPKVLQRVIFYNENYTKCQILKFKKYNASNFELKFLIQSDFELKVLQGVRFYIKNFSPRHFKIFFFIIFNLKF